MGGYPRRTQIKALRLARALQQPKRHPTGSRRPLILDKFGYKREILGIQEELGRIRSQDPDQYLVGGGKHGKATTLHLLEGRGDCRIWRATYRTTRV